MVNNRALMIILFGVIFFAVLIAKLIDIQIVKSEELSYFAKRQQTKVENITPERGLIYDRNGVLLVYNATNYTFFADKAMLLSKQKNAIAERFSKVIGRSVDYYMKLMKEKRRIIYLDKKVTSEKAALLKNLGIPGLAFDAQPARVYHYGSLASHILGYVNTDYSGVNGIAKSFNSQLKGVPGSRLVERDAMGQIIAVADNESEKAVAGDNLFLTINKTFQEILEDELNTGLKDYGGTSATGIIMNPNTGEILALANEGTFDPNDYWNFTDDQRRDRAITDTYEPGSTFKTFTLASLLDQNLCKESDLVYVENGRYKFKNVYISDTHKNTYLTVKGIIEESSNIGISKLVQKIDNNIYYKYIRGFGFGNYTSIDLPGEAKGFLKKPGEWSAVTKAFMSFGYEISVTPIQLISAYCAIVNGGILYKPQIVKKEVDSNGQLVWKCKPEKVRTVISPSTSKRMRNLLIGVVKNGTGKNANTDLIEVGGKTGTSQKLVDGSYSKKLYNSSFVGFFPADNPKVVCLILVNAPELGRYGGLVAAPIFKKVTEQIVKSGYNFNNEQNDNEKDNIKTKIAFTKNTNSNTAALENKYSKEQNKILASEKNKVMPDLTGYSVRDAVFALSDLGLKYKIIGNGKVISQSISTGSKIQQGSFITLNCKEITVSGAAVY